ncbi:MAG TPA: hypothetical protein VG755_36480 [Nannocystaceae bacterium]|nr:hypothetical protein [Nannocystaceae bacterium]
MGSLRPSTKVVVLASLAVGVALTFASGESKADRDVAHELLRANESLAEKLDAQQVEIAELRARLDAASAKPGPKNPGTTQPGDAPQTKVEAEVKEAFEFRKKVLAALKPELEGIDAKFVASKDALDKHKEKYAKHTHQYDVVSHGWVRLDTMLTSDGVDVLRPTYSDDWIAIKRTDNGNIPESSTSRSTTTPK